MITAEEAREESITVRNRRTALAIEELDNQIKTAVRRGETCTIITIYAADCLYIQEYLRRVGYTCEYLPRTSAIKIEW
jgi:hypothetical protein